MKNLLGKSGVILVTCFVLFAMPALAKDPIYKGFLSNSAVGGYDAVTYFTIGKPVKGNKKYKTEYQGADWIFSSKENLVAFKSNPDKYAPQYGGYCAWAVAQGDTAKGDPKYWTIHNDKLYLNYNTDIQNKWLKEKDLFIIKADKNWPSVLK